LRGSSSTNVVNTFLGGANTLMTGVKDRPLYIAKRAMRFERERQRRRVGTGEEAQARERAGLSDAPAGAD
jgi:hypothetical protein